MIAHGVKRLVFITFLLLVLAGSVGWAVGSQARGVPATAVDHRAETGQRRQYAEYERVMWIAAGPADSQLGYSTRNTDQEQLGPQAFWVFPDGTIRILDSVKNRLVDYLDGVYIREMALPAGTHARDMVVTDGLTYLLVEASGRHVLVLDEEGLVQRAVPLVGEWADTVHSLQPRASGSPVVVGIDGLAMDLDSAIKGESRRQNHNMLAFNVEVEYSHEVDSTKAKVDTMILTGRNLREIMVWHVDDSATIFLSYLDLANTSLVGGDLVVCSYHPLDGIGGVAALPIEDQWSWPTRWLNVTPDGCIYWLRILNGGVAIDRIHLGTEYVSVIESLEEEWQREKAAQLQTQEVFSIPPDISRQQVFSNSSLNINHRWTYRQANAQPVPSGVTKPKWLADITTYPTSLTGIPYCWGGFDSVNTAHSWVGWSDFNDAMARDAFAGNVYCAGNYKTGTAGLDCAGFVSACLEWSTHCGTPTIWDVKSYSIDENQRLYMDIYIKRSSHVLFYVSDSGLGIISREATTSEDEKCKSYSRSWAWLNREGYSLRRLYSIDPNP